MGALEYTGGEMTVRVEVATGRGVAERWRKQYQNSNGGWTRTISGDSEKTYNKLCDLGENPDIAKVAEIIGNKGWSYVSCNGCGEHVTRAVNFVERYSENEPTFCEPCIREALTALTATGAA